MKIGALAEATGTPIVTIRFYEQEGLLPAPPRGENNYRAYQPAHVERLAFIRQCRNLDMTLDEIRSLIELRRTPEKGCGEVNALLEEHIGHVDERIRALQSLKKELTALRARCASPSAVGDCGILSGLDTAEVSAPIKGKRRHVHGAH